MEQPPDTARRIALQIRAATDAAQKTYTFDDEHDPHLPADRWFQGSTDGLVLFIVFYTQACRWSACSGCNLPSVSASGPVGFPALARQVDHVLDDPAVCAKKAAIAKVIVSNNGSVLDEVTFPTTALMYLVARLNLELPAMRVLSLESRPEYVDVEELEFLARAMRERPVPAEIELAVGFEAFDDGIRNKVFLKGLSLRTFEALVERIRHPHFRLKCYFMQKPVATLSDAAAVTDVCAGIDYLDGVARRSGVAMNLHLNPTYVAHGTPLEAAFLAGDYTPPRLTDVARAVLHGAGKALSIFVGLNDEGLAVSGGSFLRREDGPLVEVLERFNRTQDYATLRRSCEGLGVFGTVVGDVPD
ncbi:MAG: hypothetical protein JW751_24000 [Polyangiaceae bacterium]|nr:hypothetical protein [Polyangiaceae bacterium]